MFFCRQLHVLLLSMVVAAAAVAVLSICVDAVRMRLLWLSIICFVLFIPSTTHRKDRAVFTKNTLESPLLSQSRHDLVFKGNLRLQINQKSTSHRRIKRLRERHAKDDPVRKIQASKQLLPQ